MADVSSTGIVDIHLTSHRVVYCKTISSVLDLASLLQWDIINKAVDVHYAVISDT